MPARRPGRTVNNGYGAAHIKLRRRWAPLVATGQVICWRCHRRIMPGTKWFLGHDDDRRFYRGPEHARCGCSGNQHNHRAPAKALSFFG